MTSGAGVQRAARVDGDRRRAREHGLARRDVDRALRRDQVDRAVVGHDEVVDVDVVASRHVSPPPVFRSPPKIAEFTLMSTSACEVRARAGAQHARDDAGFARADVEIRRGRAAASRPGQPPRRRRPGRGSRACPCRTPPCRPPLPPFAPPLRLDRAGKRVSTVGPDDDLAAVALRGGIRLQARAGVDRGLHRAVRVARALERAADLDVRRPQRRWHRGRSRSERCTWSPRTWMEPPVAPCADSAPLTSTLPPSPRSRMRPPCSTAVSALIVPVMLMRLSSTFFGVARGHQHGLAARRFDAAGIGDQAGDRLAVRGRSAGPRGRRSSARLMSASP